MTSKNEGVESSNGVPNNMRSNPIRRALSLSEGSKQLAQGQIIEIRHEDSTSSCLKSKDGKPPTVEAYVVNVKPDQCSTLVKQLAIDLPLGLKEKGKDKSNKSRNIQDTMVDLSHLKRVHKRAKAASLQQDLVSVLDGTDQEGQTSSGEPPAKKKKKDVVDLRILVGAASVFDRRFNDGDCDNSDGEGCSDSHVRLHQLLESYSPMEKILVPSRPPSSRDEWEEWNNRWWPTIYSPLKWQEHREEQLALKLHEVQQMRRFVNEILLNNDRNAMGSRSDTHANASKSDVGCIRTAIVVDPISDKLVASSWLEEEMQQRKLDQCLQGQTSTRNILVQNPLVTPIMLALQGVSRLERDEVMKASKEALSNVPEQRHHQQYLCTGYDLYTTHEPTVAEAMACVHSRLRRLIYLFSSSSEPNQSWNPAFENGCSKHFVHCLPGTNHKYRVFRFQLEENLGTGAAQM